MINALPQCCFLFFVAIVAFWQLVRVKPLHDYTPIETRALAEENLPHSGDATTVMAK